MSFPSGALAQDARLTDDAYVTTAHPNTNYGSASSLLVETGNSTSFTFLKFFFNLPPGTTGDNVAKAVLTLYVNNVGTGGDVALCRVVVNWSEATVTYASMPGQIFTGCYQAPLPGATNSFLSIDVTSIVKACLNGTATNYGFGLISDFLPPPPGYQSSVQI